VTFDTCEIIEERWANWQRQDPVVAIETQAGNLRRLKALYIDCGEKDQFNLLYGARRFVRRLVEASLTALSGAASGARTPLPGAAPQRARPLEAANARWNFDVSDINEP
jgi:hypothetical protein